MKPDLALSSAAAAPTRSPRASSGDLAIRFARLSRWEFWPAWAIYLPLMPYIFWLGLKHRGLAVCTACNPAIPLGGFVGESKSQILALLPPDVVVPFELLAPDSPASRLARLTDILRDRNWSWPIVLKPDSGERGEGVRLTRDLAAALDYFAHHPEPVIAQAYHPGPHEAGVFYMRDPREPRGRIFSITDKRFPAVTGDGASTLTQLICAHPRFRLQAAAHLAAIGDRAGSIPARNTTVPLSPLGNHCRGTMFLDGAGLITPELADAFERIASQAEGFFFGRFDVRYTSPDEFRRGIGFSIVELNGLLSESTNIYDPAHSFTHAQRVLRAQWRHAFRIAKSNIDRGARAATLGEVLAAVRDNRRRRAIRP